MVSERFCNLTDSGLTSSSARGCEFGQVIAPLCTLIPSPVTCWCQRPLHFENVFRGACFARALTEKKTKSKPYRARNGVGSPDFLVHRARSNIGDAGRAARAGAAAHN